MPKIRETKEAYIVEPSFMESLGPALEKIVQAYARNQIIEQKQKQDLEQAELDQAKWELELTKLKQTDPEEATRLQNMPAVMRILDPKRIERMKHENESPFTRFRHRKEHETLKEGYEPPLKKYTVPEAKVGGVTLPSFEVTEGIPANAFGKGTDAFGNPKSASGRPDYTVSPQLAAARRKAVAEAEAEESKTAMEVLRNRTLTRNVEAGNEAALQKLLDVPFTKEGILAFRGRQRLIEQEVEKEVPSTPGWYEKMAVARRTELLKEFPDADPKDISEWAESIDNPDKVLTPETKKRLGPSLSKKKITLDEKTYQIRAAEYALDKQKTATALAQETMKTASTLALNGVDPEIAQGVAYKWLTTGKAPEGFVLPPDKMAEVELSIKEAQKLKFEDDHREALIQSPRFKALNDLAMRAPNDAQKTRYVMDMQKEFCKSAGPETASCDYKPGIGYTELAKEIFLVQLDRHWKAGAKAGALAEGALRGTAHALTTNPIPQSTGIGMMPTTPRSGPVQMVGEITPEASQSIAKGYADYAKRIIQDPSSSIALKTRVMENAAALKAALEKGDWAEVARINAEMKK
jgi:hypothetical protein